MQVVEELVMIPFLILVQAATAESEIIVTASREPIASAAAPVSSAVVDEAGIAALALPAAADLLRLTPGVSVAVAGPRGTQTQVRLRGAEANHTLLFVDGIRFNDPAAGNEARFELLTADLLSRVEIVRGPQSALWGAEALGGVIAVHTPDPLQARGLLGLSEYGSLDSARLFGRYAMRAGGLGVAAAAGWQRGGGIDSFGAGGERDGFDLFVSSVRAGYRAGPIELGAVGHWVAGRSEFDGFDPVTFRRADTSDETENRIGATRFWGSLQASGWSLRAEASYLDSANRNRLAGAPLNRTAGDRLSLGAQLSRRLGRHLLIAALNLQREGFRARDTAFFGGTDQDRSRRSTALAGEWRAEWTSNLTTDLAVRHDDFSAFGDATTLRAAVLVRPASDWRLHAAYGEGVAQPTFFDLFGFFPGSFAGNPSLRPERSRGWEAGAQWASGRLSLAATGFVNRLSDEIVDVFDPATFLSSTRNASGRSRRRGLEITASYRRDDALNLVAGYTLLDSGEQRVAGALLVRELRRPRHSFNLAAHGLSGRLRWGAGLAWVGARDDTDFDLVPVRTVRLDDYALASLTVAYRLVPQLELFGRVENGFDAGYRDVTGYNTPGRTVHAGLRVALGR